MIVVTNTRATKIATARIVALKMYTRAMMVNGFLVAKSGYDVKNKWSVWHRKTGTNGEFKTLKEAKDFCNNGRRIGADNAIWRGTYKVSD
jgi:hypothetical protein